MGAAEIRHVLVCMGELITDEEVDMMIKMVDSDGDGQVSFTEFYNVVTDPDPAHTDFVKMAAQEEEDPAQSGDPGQMDAKAHERHKEITLRNKKREMMEAFTVRYQCGKLQVVLQFGVSLRVEAVILAPLVRVYLSEIVSEFELRTWPRRRDRETRITPRVNVVAATASRRRGIASTPSTRPHDYLTHRSMSPQVENGVGPAEVLHCYSKFLQLPQERRVDCKVDFETYCEILSIEPTGETHMLFSLFDEGGDGDVDMKEFLLGMCNFTAMDTTERIDMIFDLFDEDKSGFLSTNELIKILQANHMQSSGSVKKKAETIIQQADKDNSGTLSRSEFDIVAQKFPSVLFPKLRKEDKEAAQTRNIQMTGKTELALPAGWQFMTE